MLPKNDRNICFALVSVFLLLTACAGPDVASGIYDPFEKENRRTHEVNLALDRALLRPSSGAYGTILPKPVRNGIGNFSSNLSMPSIVLNDLLQLQLGDAIHNTARFLVNTTLGLGGMFDVATKGGIAARSSDFGETLHVWGFKEGAFVELPVLGPSTTRDTIGGVVNLILDPVGQLVASNNRGIVTAVSAASSLGDRYQYTDTIDSILYESADSYAQARLFYLENRRFQLGISEGEDDDLYDIYGETYE
ncbi:MAG: VacJ family lipoprotein [Marinosulfonomonas sp.]|nr:VacJ family lipoprotein [Marinosulfonomonas sp.]